MKKSVKIIIAVLVIAIAIGGCVFAFTRDNYGENKKADIVLITNGCEIDENTKIDGLWNGVKEYADSKDLDSNYIIPNLEEGKELTVDNINEYIETAISNGAKYIVLPDESFAASSYEMGAKHKDVKFLLVDAIAHSREDKVIRTLENVMSVQFDKLQTGFLAGYGAVLDGYTKLGFIGSTADKSTGEYAGAFKQGATFAAQESGVNVTFDYAEYDSILIGYDYSIDIKPVYENVSDNAHKLTVVDGSGSGYYKEGQVVTLKANDAPKDKIFDHWEIKSDTQGVDASAIKTSDNKSASDNKLTVGTGDCTATAVYKDAKTQEVTIADRMGNVIKTLNLPENTTSKVEAPLVSFNMEFEEWESSDMSAIDNKTSKTINLSVKDKPISLTAKYVLSDKATFDVYVDGGSGSGAYNVGDNVNVVVNDAPEGKMFSKWEIKDAYGNALLKDAQLTNPNLTFEMPNRYKALPQQMYKDGVEIIFANGGEIKDDIFEAAKESGKGLVFSDTADDKDRENCGVYIDSDYNKLIKIAFSKFVGGSIFTGNAENGCIKLSNISSEAKIADEKGNAVPNENYNEEYALVYNGVGNNKYLIKYFTTGNDISVITPSPNLKLNFWIKGR